MSTPRQDRHVLMSFPMCFTLSPWWVTWAMMCPLTRIRQGCSAQENIAGIARTPAMGWLDDLFRVLRDRDAAHAIKLFFTRIGLRTHPTACPPMGNSSAKEQNKREMELAKC